MHDKNNISPKFVSFFVRTSRVTKFCIEICVLTPSSIVVVEIGVVPHILLVFLYTCTSTCTGTQLCDRQELQVLLYILDTAGVEAILSFSKENAQSFMTSVGGVS